MRTVVFDLTDKEGSKTEFVLNLDSVTYLMFREGLMEIHTIYGQITAKDCTGTEQLYNFIKSKL